MAYRVEVDREASGHLRAVGEEKIEEGYASIVGGVNACREDQ
jgi:hypothetical protein